jgi:uncharacterized protein
MMQAAEMRRSIPGAVATAGADERMAFVRRTYAHVAGAIFAFVAVAATIVNSGFAERMLMWVGAGQWNWLILLAMFIGVGWIAEKWARSDTSQGIQYVGLALYVVALAVIMTPLLYIAAFYSSPELIPTAAMLTLLVFGGLTLTVFMTKKDFSFLRGALAIGSLTALGLIVAAIAFGFALGTWFAGAMIVLFSGYILYQTSQILAHYRPTQHVAAALALFASVAMLFYYILYFLMSLTRD